MFKQCLSSLNLKRTYHYTIKFVSNLRQIMCFVSVSSGFFHDIAEILLEVAIKTHNTNPNLPFHNPIKTYFSNSMTIKDIIEPRQFASNSKQQICKTCNSVFVAERILSLKWSRIYTKLNTSLQLKISIARYIEFNKT